MNNNKCYQNEREKRKKKKYDISHMPAVTHLYICICSVINLEENASRMKCF